MERDTTPRGNKPENQQFVSPVLELTQSLQSLSTTRYNCKLLFVHLLFMCTFFCQQECYVVCPFLLPYPSVCPSHVNIGSPQACCLCWHVHSCVSIPVQKYTMHGGQVCYTDAAVRASSDRGWSSALQLLIHAEEDCREAVIERISCRHQKEAGLQTSNEDKSSYVCRDCGRLCSSCIGLFFQGVRRKPCMLLPIGGNF